MNHRLPAIVLMLGLVTLLSGRAAAAEEKKTPPPARSGNVVGILIDRKDAYIMVKPEGKQEPEKYLLAVPGGAVSPSVDAAVKKLFVPNLVLLKWQRQGEDAVVTEASALVPSPKRSEQVTGGRRVINYSLTGTVQGTVVACEVGDKACYIDVKPAARPDFIACAGPVELFQKAFKTGVFDLSGFQVLKQDFTERYWPAFVIDKDTKKGGFDAKAIETMKALNPGDRVTIEWYYDERKRAAKIQVLPRPAAPKPTVGPAQMSVPASQPVPSPEELARARLKAAQMYIDNDMKEQARARLREIIKLYPATEAAKEARAKLPALGD